MTSQRQQGEGKISKRKLIRPVIVKKTVKKEPSIYGKFNDCNEDWGKRLQPLFPGKPGKERKKLGGTGGALGT